MNNKKKNEGQTDFSYYGLYLLDYLRTNKFEQATTPLSYGNGPTVPPKRMKRRGSKAIPPMARRAGDGHAAARAALFPVRHPP